MPNFDRAIDKIIKDAMARGEFDNLAGKGKPLNLNKNLLVDDDWRMAFTLLEQKGFALPWIEERKYIEESLTRMKENLARTWRWREEQPQEDAAADREWRQAVTRFDETVAALNKRIDAYNLSIPADVFYRPRIIVQQEIQRLVDS